MNIRIIIIMNLFAMLVFRLPLQNRPLNCNTENHATSDSQYKQGQNVRILFWNIENLYDPFDDTLTIDEEFTRDGAKRWSYNRFLTKTNHLAKTILAAGEWNPPGIIGLCEVENRFVLNKIIYESPLKYLHYRVIHKDSPDLRGVDVALLYRTTCFQPVFSEAIHIRFPFDTTARTRDILYVKGTLSPEDTLHIFVNHWPSRRGGEAVSAPRRNYVASILRRKVDSINDNYRIRSSARLPFILIMGDFNDEPENESLVSVLRAIPDTSASDLDCLVNLMFLKSGKEGSHNYKGHWAILDQFIVSRSFLSAGSPLLIKPASICIFRPGFMMEEDIRYLDKKPKRTYIGPRYAGGFSDHLPILVDIKIQPVAADH